MVRNSREEWKIYNNVFDNFTERVLFKLMSQKVIEGLVSPIKIGKESNIFSADSDTQGVVVVKIYRLESCNFNKMYDYIKQDMRYINLKKNRRDIIFNWVQREYRNLMKARDMGVRVPTPFTFSNNVIVLEYIGDQEPAPQLKDAIPKNKQKFLNDLIKNLRLLYHKAGLVHGDLSEFNILNYNENPVLIDFSQCTITRSNAAKELMKRDVGNLCRFYKKIGMELDAEEIIKKIIKP